MWRKGIYSLHFLHKYAAERESAKKEYLSTLWGYHKAVAYEGKVKKI